MKIYLNLTFNKETPYETKVEHLPGIIEDQEIIFDYEDTQTIVNLEKQILKRENEEYLLNLNIQEQTCLLKLPKENLELDINVDNSIMIVKDTTCYIEYLIETENEIKKIEITWEEENERDNN